MTYLLQEIVNYYNIHVSSKKNFISELLYYTLSERNILVLDNLALMKHYKKHWMDRKVFDRKSNWKESAKLLRFTVFLTGMVWELDGYYQSRTFTNYWWKDTSSTACPNNHVLGLNLRTFDHLINKSLSVPG